MQLRRTKYLILFFAMPDAIATGTTKIIEAVSIFYSLKLHIYHNENCCAENSL